MNRRRTKLINCNSKVFVYDFVSKKRAPMLGLEKDPKANIIFLKRLLLTNFMSEELQTVFHLKMDINKYESAEDKLNSFIVHLQNLIGRSDIKYLAVAELPSEAYEQEANILLITDISIHESLLVLGDTISEEEEMEFFQNIWGDDLFYDFYYLESQITTLTSTYQKSLYSNTLKKHPRLFYSNLKQPTVYWDEEADIFIKQHNLLDCSNQTSMEVFDEVAGFIIISEYSLSEAINTLQDME